MQRKTEQMEDKDVKGPPPTPPVSTQGEGMRTVKLKTVLPWDGKVLEVGERMTVDRRTAALLVEADYAEYDNETGG